MQTPRTRARGRETIDANTPDGSIARGGARGASKGAQTSPLSVLLLPLSPASASPASARGIGASGEGTNPAHVVGAFAREDEDGEPRTPRGEDADFGPFANENDGAARWAPTSKSVEVERRRAKTRSVDLDFDFRSDGRDGDADEPMFRVFGRDIGKPPRGGGGLFNSFGSQREGSGSEGMNDLSSSWGSRNEREFGSSLSRMNSLAETKVLTSTLLVRQTSVSSDAVFEFDEHFQYEQQIGSSQNSEVWLVTSKTSGRAFVVKKCLHAFTTDAQRAKLRREVEAAALLPEHPNIVRYFRSWQKEQLFYIQMEHCACGSLSSVLARLPQGNLIAELDVWRLTAQVASGLAFMHAHKIIHLDIKPDNIYIDVHGTCKIGDLGLAYVQDAGWDWEEGDGGYVAPELLNMLGSDAPAPSADVFSLGVTLYEAASGLRFPRGATPRASLPPLPEGRSAELARLVDGCLATDPDQRATAQDVATFAQETVALLEQNAAR